jgi:CxxC motif-containing protein (DUF1111 family)
MKVRSKLNNAVMLLSMLFVASCNEQQVASEESKEKVSKAVPKFEANERRTGGELTHKRLYASYIYPGYGVDNQKKLDFWGGFSFFRDPWVAAPSATGNRDGLGPLFNTRSCIACHTAGSRAKLDKSGEILPLSLVVRLGPIEPDRNGADAVDPSYGGQIQPRAISYRLTDINKDSKGDNKGYGKGNNRGEAWLNVSYTKITGKFDDGISYELLKPNYQLTKLAYGALAPHIGLSVRLAPNIFGMGLLNAISEKDLLAQEDIDDRNGDGISAKYNRVPNVLTTPKTGAMQVGRFGFKAKQPNLYQQVAAAFRDDIGITNSSFPQDTCTETQIACEQASDFGGHHEGNFEIDDKRLALTVIFNELMGVPAARDLQSEEVQEGRTTFYQLACHKCHTPSYVTGANEHSVLANQTIWPYSDLALHDMGEELADGVFEFNATGNEWRTAPLWGIGLQKQKTGQQRFLHDGRARTITEAILWHGGEAEQHKQTFKALNKQQRQALVSFVEAI